MEKIKLYMGLKGSNELQKVCVEGPDDKMPGATAMPFFAVPPKNPSVSVTMFLVPYKVRVGALKSQTRFYGSKSSIRRSLKMGDNKLMLMRTRQLKTGKQMPIRLKRSVLPMRLHKKPLLKPSRKTARMH